MADIPSVIQKLNDVEINSDEVVSEQLFTKIGGSINGLIDKTSSLVETYVQFLSNTTWVCPNGINTIYVEGCGGGASGTDSNSLKGQRLGGRGAPLTRKRLKVIPGQSYSMTIGAGAGGDNNDGAASTITRAGVTLFSAPGGSGMIQGNGQQVVSDSVFAETIGNVFNGIELPGGGLAWGGGAGPYGNGANGSSGGTPSSAVPNSGGGGGGQSATSGSGGGGSGRLIISYFG